MDVVEGWRECRDVGNRRVQYSDGMETMMECRSLGSGRVD